MSTLPLYDILSTNIKNTDLTSSQKLKFVNDVKKMRDTEYELIYIIIRLYQTNNSRDEDIYTYKVLPYGGIIDKKDIKFNLEMLPFCLKQILFKFSEMYNKKNIESKKLNRINFWFFKRLVSLHNFYLF